MSDAYEMGWNDVIGNLRRATEASDNEKRAFCLEQKAKALAGASLGLAPTQNTDDYRQGVIAACDAFFGSQALSFKGPPDVVAHLELLCGG